MERLLVFKLYIRFDKNNLLTDLDDPAILTYVRIEINLEKIVIFWYEEYFVQFFIDFLCL